MSEYDYNWDAIFAAAAALDEKREKPSVENTASSSSERIVMLSPELLEDHPSYIDGIPFRPASEERIGRMAESIRRNGILSPLLVRPAGKRFQILGGHCRKRAAMRCGYTELPCIVKDVEDEAAIDLLLTDNLLQRLDGLLPSEKAFAYKMRLDVMERQGERTDLTSSQFETKLRADEQIGVDMGESRATVQRYIRLTHLIPGLLDMVDARQIGLQTACGLSYLTQETQKLVQKALEAGTSRRVTAAMAQELRKLDERLLEPVSEADVAAILNVPMQRAPRVLKLKWKPLRNYFPTEAGQKEISETILKALDFYFSSGGT